MSAATDLVTRARIRARTMHAGQRDQQGRDYFDAHLVPIAAALAPFGDVAEAGGYLHDIVEDTEDTAEALRADGYPESLVDGVIAVTRDYFGPEDYNGPTGSLICRSAADPLGNPIKLADNTWNILCNAGLAKTNSKKARRLLGEKYLPARRHLLTEARYDALAVFEMEMTLREHLTRLERGERALFPEMTPCRCDGAAFRTDAQNAARVPFLVSPGCPMHGTPPR